MNQDASCLAVALFDGQCDTIAAPRAWTRTDMTLGNV